jgi:hypothetical protein
LCSSCRMMSELLIKGYERRLQVDNFGLRHRFRKTLAIPFESIPPGL